MLCLTWFNGCPCYKLPSIVRRRPAIMSFIKVLSRPRWQEVNHDLLSNDYGGILKVSLLALRRMCFILIVF